MELKVNQILLTGTNTLWEGRLTGELFDEIVFQDRNVTANYEPHVSVLLTATNYVNVSTWVNVLSASFISHCLFSNLFCPWNHPSEHKAEY